MLAIISNVMQFKIAECQREILEARAKVEEAERSLSINMGEDGDRASFLETESKEINKEEERLESVKAALVSAIVGTFAGLPIFLTQVTSSSQLLLPLAINFVSCALFGITFRYTIRRDLDNIQLKTGTSAAFGFVKGTIYTYLLKNKDFKYVKTIREMLHFSNNFMTKDTAVQD